MQEELRSIAAMAGPRELGNLTLAAEDARAQWGWTRLEQTGQDVRYAVRTLAKAPGFTAGSGALARDRHRRQHRALHADQHGDVEDAAGRRSGAPADDRTADADRRHLRLHVSAVRDLPGSRRRARPRRLFAPCGWTSASTDTSSRRRTRTSSPASTSRSFGLRPALGRLFDESDDRVPMGHPVAVLGHAYWQRRFGGDPAVLGRTITLGGLPFTIVGVTPAEFFGAEVGMSPSLYLPVMMQPAAAADEREPARESAASPRRGCACSAG